MDYDYYAEYYPSVYDTEYTINEDEVIYLSASEKGEVFTILVNDKIMYSVNILDLLDPYFDIEEESGQPQEIIITDENDNIKVKLIFKHAFYDSIEEHLTYSFNLLFSIK